MIKKRTFFVAIALFSGVLVLMALIWQKIWVPSRLAAGKYPVTGVDVSAYQGEIDWAVLEQQGISFAYIKATEGSAFEDPCFADNWENARKTGLRVGAYHFFSFDSPGVTQAENFIRNVPLAENMLPPAVDLEFYGNHEKNPPAKEDVWRELKSMLDLLEAHYGMKPVLYATQKSYGQYLSGKFADYALWIRNVYTPPFLPDGREWFFWQYTDRGRLDGYRGEEPNIDLNVFRGSVEEFAGYPG